MSKRMLVIDVGNSEVVAAAYVDDEQESILRVGVRAGWEQWIETFVSDHLATGPISVMVASVNPDINPLFVQLFKKLKQPVAFLEADSDEVGADRMANALGAHKMYKGTVIVVDIGTAVTFDVVADRHFLGGAIAPGFGLSSWALSTGTRMLPEVELRRPGRVVSTSIEGNICSGVYHGVLGGIERTLRLMKAELGKPVVTVATGGILSELGPTPDMGLEELSTGLREDLAGIVDHIEPELTLIGIKEALKESTHVLNT